MYNATGATNAQNSVEWRQISMGQSSVDLFEALGLKFVHTTK